MPNKAINQLDTATDRQPGDVFHVERSLSDYKMDESYLPPAIKVQTTVIATADVLTLNATPVVVVPAAPAGYVNVPCGGVVEFSGGTTNYAANTTLMLVTTTVPGSALRIASIADRTLPNTFVVPATLLVSPAFDGDSISAQVETGDPTTGDSDLTITVWYYLMPI